ncbi:MAG TPA: glycosyl hydrolase family 28-related protein [Candidatus Saccharimonadales bacterium]|nr:glycosyl hydrolase family 28-related protein [Candidatus Saccharimonadales bacterium]
MTRLPVPGSDHNMWGDILNEFLKTAHNSDGSIKAGAVGDTQVSQLSQSKIQNLSTDLAAKAIDTTVVHKDELVFNVKDHGAKGDNSTNDTTAIQSTITAAAAAGGSVYIPSGFYIISAALTLPAKTIIRGDGQDRSIIVQQSTSANGITITDANYIVLEDFRLQGPASGTGVGISLQRSSSQAIQWHRYQGLYIREFGSHGIAASNAVLTILNNVTCESNGGHGFYFFGVAMSTAGTSTQFNACYANNNGQAGYALFKMVYCVLTACAADSSGIGYLIDTCQGCSLVGCGSEFMANKSVSYPGVGFKITASLSIGIYNAWTNHNISSSWWVTGSSVGVTMLGVHENEPEAAATALVKVDSGCSVTLADYGSTDGSFAPTPNDLASGTTTILNDGLQGITVPGLATLVGGFSVGATAFPRFRATTNGGLDWGPGGSGVDTNLYRGGSGVLVTDGTMTVGGSLQHNGSAAGFYGTTAISKPTVSGSKGGNAALASLITALANLGLINDSTS